VDEMMTPKGAMAHGPFFSGTPLTCTGNRGRLLAHVSKDAPPVLRDHDNRRIVRFAGAALGAAARGSEEHGRRTMGDVGPRPGRGLDGHGGDDVAAV